MDMELNDSSDLKDAYQGRYKGDDIHLKRISNEVKALRGEYNGFGTYLKRLSTEAKAKRANINMKSFPTTKVAFSVASLAVAGIGLFLYLTKNKKKQSAESLF